MCYIIFLSYAPMSTVFPMYVPREPLCLGVSINCASFLFPLIYIIHNEISLCKKKGEEEKK